MKLPEESIFHDTDLDDNNNVVMNSKNNIKEEIFTEYD